MDDRFKIYIEQLRDGRIENIEETFDPSFLDTEEDDRRYNHPVHVTGEAYIASDELILHFDISTGVEIPCKICNKPTEIPVHVQGLYHDVPLEEVASGLFYYNEVLRDAILLEIPEFTECHEGNCPEREQIKKYLKKPDKIELNDKDIDGYQPFKDLKLE